MTITLGPQTKINAARGLADKLSLEARSAFVALLSSCEGEELEAAVKAVTEQITFSMPFKTQVDPAGALLAALDYVLPRMTAAGGWVRDDIRRQWNELGEATRHEIKRRIRTALETNRAGMEVDRREWKILMGLPADKAEKDALTAF